MTKRHAKARIINKTGHDIITASIVHKYSDNYKNMKTLGKIPNGATSSEYLEVDYNTGVGTLGKDWWLVTWQYDDEKVYYTDPNNFRGIFDFMEKIASSAASSEMSPVLADAMFNSEGTSGFKQHTLRSKDQKKFVDFILMPNGKVEIKSVSGTPSKTVYSSKKAKATA